MLIGHPVREKNGQLHMNYALVLTPVCPFGVVHHGQVRHLKQAVVGGKYGFDFRHFPELAVETFDSVSGINQPRESLGKQ